jgi:hypothetical protein
MSLKAGGVGINLTAASNAFVMVRAYQFLLLKLMCICNLYRVNEVLGFVE